MLSFRVAVFALSAAILAAGCSNQSGWGNSPRSANSATGESSTFNANSNTDLRASGNLNGSGNMSANQDTSIAGNFWQEAAASGLAEVELGKLATTNAQSPDVKQFGQMMVQDHTAANDELKPIAQRKNIPLPNSLDSMHKTINDRLAGMSGPDFDREFIDVMTGDHQKAVQLFQATANSDTDPDAKSFASKTLPVLEKHLQQAKSIQAKLK